MAAETMAGIKRHKAKRLRLCRADTSQNIKGPWQIRSCLLRPPAQQAFPDLQAALASKSEKHRNHPGTFAFSRRAG